jgi:hypothetical protein
MKPDHAVNVVVLRPPGSGWVLTRDGEAALDAAEAAEVMAELAHGRGVADEAPELAVRRRNQPIPAPRQPLV